MREVTLKVYKFEELSEEVQEEVCESFHQEDLNNNVLMDIFTQDTVNELEEKGFIDVDLRYSLNYCQGDGLSFTFDTMTLGEICKALGVNHELDSLIERAEGEVDSSTINHHYSHVHTIDLDFNYYSANLTEEDEIILKDLESIIEEKYVNTCMALAKKGYKHFETEYTTEYVQELCDINGYEFDEYGTLY